MYICLIISIVEDKGIANKSGCIIHIPLIATPFHLLYPPGSLTYCVLIKHTPTFLHHHTLLHTLTPPPPPPLSVSAQPLKKDDFHSILSTREEYRQALVHIHTPHTTLYIHMRCTNTLHSLIYNHVRITDTKFSIILFQSKL